MKIVELTIKKLIQIVAYSAKLENGNIAKK
jgi:hypothetical protein